MPENSQKPIAQIKNYPKIKQYYSFLKAAATTNGIRIDHEKSGLIYASNNGFGKPRLKNFQKEVESRPFLGLKIQLRIF